MIDAHLLDKIGLHYQTDKCSKYSRRCWGDLGHNYLDIYQRYFDPCLKEHACHVLEIGIASGASHKMWVEYFTKAHIYGLDIRIPIGLSGPRIHLFRGNQNNRGDLQLVMAAAGGLFDIIIDDGGHHPKGQQTSLGYLFRFLKPGGFYVIEDLCTSHEKEDITEPMRPGWTTLKIVQQLAAGDTFESEFMTSDEIAYLQGYTNVIIEVGQHSEIAFIRKVAA